MRLETVIGESAATVQGRCRAAMRTAARDGTADVADCHQLADRNRQFDVRIGVIRLDPMSDPEASVDWLVAANRLALIATQLANVIHEANNILQIIGGNAELIAMADARPVVAERARAIADQTQRASDLLAEVL